MALRFFTIPVRDGGEAQDELNRFLAAGRVLRVERRFIEAAEEENSFWSVAVETIESPPSGRPAKGKRIDYLEVLPPEQFAVFAKLREVRKELALAEGAPPFLVFTDEQLAAMVTQAVDSLAKLREIPGVGEAKAAKYGERMLAVLAAARETGTGPTADTASGPNGKGGGSGRARPGP